jgi:hypothetical protein
LGVLFHATSGYYPSGPVPRDRQLQAIPRDSLEIAAAAS